jgi:hypothetical protein
VGVGKPGSPTGWGACQFELTASLTKSVINQISCVIKMSQYSTGTYSCCSDLSSCIQVSVCGVCCVPYVAELVRLCSVMF